MIPAIDVRHTLGKLSAELGLYPKEHKAAAVRALNRTMTTVRAESARSLQKEYPGVKVAALKKRLRFRRANQKDMRAAIDFSGRRIVLFGNFGMRAVGKWGVRFSKLPWRIEGVSGDVVTPEILARAFRQRGTGGRANVMSRWTKYRQSAEILLAPGVARALAERGIGEALVRLGRTRFAVVFEQEAKFRLSKRSA